MLLTLKILFQPDSTEGVEENQTTAAKNKASVAAELLEKEIKEEEKRG
jgi:hypothetical protein